MVEAGPWGCLFWREMTVTGKINFLSLISFQWCPLKMLLTKMTGKIGQPWHRRCPSRLLGKGFLPCNTLSSSPSTTLSPTLPPWVCKKDDLLKPCKEPSLLNGFLCKPNCIHKGWEGGERKRYMGGGGRGAKFFRAWDCQGQINIAIKSWVRH